MTRDTYRGVRISARALRGRDYGRVRLMVGGETFGDWIHRDEESGLESLRRTIDSAYARPEAYPDYWRAP